jgi:hypothetical protein
VIDSAMVASNVEVKRPVRFHRWAPLEGFLDLHEVLNRLGSLRYPKYWGDSVHRDLPLFLLNGYPYQYVFKGGKTERLPKRKLSPNGLRLRKNAAIRYNKVVLELARVLQKGELTAYYIVPTKLAPVRMKASPIWVQQGRSIFASGRVRIDSGDGTEKNYRVVIAERPFSMWVNPAESSQPKLSTFKGTLSSELRDLLISNATRHEVTLTKARTWELVKTAAPAGLTKSSFFARVFDLLPSALRQAKKAPIKKDRTSFENDLNAQLAIWAASHFPSVPK